MWFHLHTVCFALSNQITELRYVTYHYQDSGFRDSMLEVVFTIESNRRVSTQSFVNDVGICSQGYWNKKAPTDWNRGESALLWTLPASSLQVYRYPYNNTPQIKLQSILTHLNPFS